MIKKLNLLSKLWLKHTDRAAYRRYKWELKNAAQGAFNDHYSGLDRLTTLPKLQRAAQEKGFLTVCHSGNAGDVIYALPTLKRLHELTGIELRFYLRLDQPIEMIGFDKHAVGTMMLNKKMADMLSPLLSRLPYLDYRGPLGEEAVDVNLDFFRSGAFSLDHSNIARWCGMITGVSPELWNSWLVVEPDTAYANTIVLARSERYTNQSINHSFLSAYPNLVFVGVEPEYQLMKRQILGLRWVEVNDFYELARIIAGCKFFIGNQSFPYSIAEALKVPRMLEVYYHLTNVVPEGPGANEFFFQDHFEALTAQLNDRL